MSEELDLYSYADLALLRISEELCELGQAIDIGAFDLAEIMGCFIDSTLANEELPLPPKQKLRPPKSIGTACAVPAWRGREYYLKFRPRRRT